MIALFRRVFRLSPDELDLDDQAAEDFDLRNARTEAGLARDLARRRIENRADVRTFLEEALIPYRERDIHT